MVSYCDGKKVGIDQYQEELTDGIRNSSWIDGLQRKVKLRESAIEEFKLSCDAMSNQNAHSEIQGCTEMYEFICDIYLNCNCNFDDLNEEQKGLHDFAYQQLIHVENRKSHLPIPVFSFMRPTNGIQFLNHILLSMGEFSTEIELMTHQSIRDCFRYAKMIGDGEGEVDLQVYSNELLVKYIKEQLCYFPNSMREIYSHIIQAGIVFDKAIVDGEIAMSDMPPVQFSIFAKSMQEELAKERENSFD